MKRLQPYVLFFSRGADQIKQAPAPAQSGFNLHGPRCQSNLTTPRHPPRVHISPGFLCSHTFSVGSFSHRGVTRARCELTIYAATAVSDHPPVRATTAWDKVVLRTTKQQRLLLVEVEKTPHTVKIRSKI